MRNILGKWKSKNKDTDEIVIMEFCPDQTLTYTVALSDGRKQIVKLIYEIQGNYIFTDQPSNPYREKTKFKITSDRLTLVHENVESYYKRIED